MVTREATVPPPFRNLPEINSMRNTSAFGFTVNTVSRGSLFLKNRLLSDLKVHVVDITYHIRVQRKNKVFTNDDLS